MYYPEGAILLDTRIRYGRISFEDGDVMIWHQRWKPSERAVKGIARDWGTVLEARVQFRSLGSGDVAFTVSNAQPKVGWSLFKWLTFLGVVGLAIYGIWRLALV